MTEQDCADEKKSLRKKMRQTLSSLDPIAKAFESASLCLRFLQSQTYKTSRAIFGFMPLNDEVDILPIFRAAISDGKKVLLPRISAKAKTGREEFSECAHGNSSDKIFGSGTMDFYFVERDPIEETEANTFGIYEPKPSCKKADIETLCAEMGGEKISVLVPGLAFTKDGFRLGRGGGYYDRFLEKLRKLCDARENNSKKPNFVGVCYAAQILQSIPCAQHDIKMDTLLSAQP